MKKEHILLGVVILIFGIAYYLRLVNIMTAEMWFDPAFSFIASQQKSFFDLAFTPFDVHSPVFNFVLKAWMSIFGFTILQQRFLTVIFGMAFVFSMLYVTVKLYDKRTAIISTLISALSLPMVAYSDEGRSYMLSCLIIIWVYWFWEQKQYGKATALFVLALYTHYYSAFFALYFIFSMLNQQKEGVKSAIRALLYGFLATIPLLIYFYFQTIRLERMWLKTPSLLSIPSAFYNQFFIPPSGVMANINSILPFFFILLVFVLIFFFVDYKKERNSFGLLVIFLYIPLTMLFCAFVLHFPYHHRFLLPFAFAGYILLGIAFGKLWDTSNLVCMLFIVVFLMFGAMAYDNYYSYTNQELQTIAKYFIDNNLCEGGFTKTKFNNISGFELKMPTTILHESPFSELSMMVYLPNCEHYLKTDLTERQGHSAGFDVIPQSHINAEGVEYTYYLKSQENYCEGETLLQLDGIEVKKCNT